MKKILLLLTILSSLNITLASDVSEASKVVQIAVQISQVVRMVLVSQLQRQIRPQKVLEQVPQQRNNFC